MAYDWVCVTQVQIVTGKYIVCSCFESPWCWVPCRAALTLLINAFNHPRCLYFRKVFSTRRPYIIVSKILQEIQCLGSRFQVRLQAKFKFKIQKQGKRSAKWRSDTGSGSRLGLRKQGALSNARLKLDYKKHVHVEYDWRFDWSFSRTNSSNAFIKDKPLLN